uniref:Forkhead box protein M1 n=1 Tax=Periophthalmus magnuspinnatus TaxID=409849 RepID=A0A3B3ZCT5_9GOBI
MRRSPRRPLILKRRKLPFQQNDTGPALHSDKVATEDASQANSTQCIPNGVCIMDHPSMSATQVVVVPKTADIQNVIGVLTAKGKECGAQGPNKFILLSGDNGNSNGSFSHLTLQKNNLSSEITNRQMNVQNVKHINAIKACKDMECGPLDDSLTNIQWLGRMNTCSLEQHPTKPITDKEKLQVSQVLQVRLSLKPPLSERPPYSYMAMIQFAINSKQSRRMTLKEIYMWIENHFPYFREVAKPGWKNSIRHNLSLHDMFIRETSTDGKVSFWTIRPEANRCLTLDQVYKVSTTTIRIAPKVCKEAVEVPVNSATPKVTPKQPTSSSRRKQRLVHSLHEEPLLLCHGNTFLDSGVVSDISTFNDIPDTVMSDEENINLNQELSFKTPIKSSNHLTSSTPSKPPCNMFPEKCKVTPVDKHGQTVLDFSPIRTPGGPAVTPRHDYTTFSFSSTPFKDLPLFSSPRELLTRNCFPSEGLVLDTMNDSLSKILVDISFPGLDDEDLGMANISWSEFIPHLK